MAAMLEAYNQRIAAGRLNRDPAQAEIVARLDSLAEAIAAARAKAAAKSGFFARFRKSAPALLGVYGLYLYGKVGRGKTMLMDLFYASLPEGDKCRIHFNDFMADVQARLAAVRAAEKAGTLKLPSGGAVEKVAQDLADAAHILCFDEFAVGDIADAMILARLFTALFARGMVLIATSNVAPDDLYRNGLNRPLFLPFISLLKQNAEICNLDAPTDYRLAQGNAAEFPAYLAPADNAAKAQMDAFWRELTGQAGGKRQEITVLGHKIAVPIAAPIAEGSPFYAAAVAQGQQKPFAARFDFADLGGRNLAAHDYAALAGHYALFMVENAPHFGDDSRNAAKRFILLIDTLYDRHMPLCLSAAARPEQLYIGAAQITEKFEFERTASRLIEMQSAAYLKNLYAPHGAK